MLQLYKQVIRIFLPQRAAAAGCGGSRQPAAINVAVPFLAGAALSSHSDPNQNNMLDNDPYSLDKDNPSENS